MALAFSIVHATTWFVLTPKVVRVRRGRRYLADDWLVGMKCLLLVPFDALAGRLVMRQWQGGRNDSLFWPC